LLQGIEVRYGKRTDRKVDMVEHENEGRDEYQDNGAGRPVKPGINEIGESSYEKVPCLEKWFASLKITK
jgi:hypothetical protein